MTEPLKLERGDAEPAIARRRTGSKGGCDRRPGSLLPRGPDRPGRPRRGRRGHGLFLDAASERGAAHGGARARRASNAVTVDRPPHGRRLRRQGDAANLFARVAALAAKDRPRRSRSAPTATTTWIVTGKRHDFLIDYEVGFDDEGRILARRRTFAARCGFSADLSGPVPTARCSTPTTPTTCPGSPAALEAAEDQHRLEHRLPRLRRAAGHDRRSSG